MPKLAKRREVDEVQDFYDTLLRAGPFPHTDDINEARCNAILQRITDYRKGVGGDDIDAELLEPELMTAVIIMVHGGRDPAVVPYKYIRHAIDNPCSIDVYRKGNEWVVKEALLAVPPKVRETVKGPVKAVRAFCINCMGGSNELIRACPSINCFLWPFRMGSNPFYSRLYGGNSDENDDGFEGADEAAATQAEFEAAEALRMGADNANS